MVTNEKAIVSTGSTVFVTDLIPRHRLCRTKMPNDAHCFTLALKTTRPCHHVIARPRPGDTSADTEIVSKEDCCLCSTTDSLIFYFTLSFTVLFYHCNKSIANNCMIPRHCKHFHSPIFSKRFSLSPLSRAAKRHGA